MTTFAEITENQVNDLKDGQKVKIYHKKGGTSTGIVKTIDEKPHLETKKTGIKVIPIIAQELKKVHKY